MNDEPAIITPAAYEELSRENKLLREQLHRTDPPEEINAVVCKLVQEKVSMSFYMIAYRFIGGQWHFTTIRDSSEECERLWPASFGLSTIPKEIKVIKIELPV